MASLIDCSAVCTGVGSRPRSHFHFCRMRRKMQAWPRSLKPSVNASPKIRRSAVAWLIEDVDQAAMAWIGGLQLARHRARTANVYALLDATFGQLLQGAPRARASARALSPGRGRHSPRRDTHA